MNSEPNKQITAKSRPTNSGLPSTRGKDHHGGQFLGFNPSAREFVPGNGDSHSSRERSISQAVTECSSHKAAAVSNKRSGRKAGRASADSEGGLSRAFRSSPHAKESHRASQDGQQTNKQQPAHADTGLLGRSPSRNFTSANHLLNFQYDRSRGGSRGVGPGRGKGQHRNAPKPEPYDRNKFLQANFRFLVSDAADLREHSTNADLMLDWGDVIEVEMLVTQPLKCPISLDSPPLCPQITPCGHVFAFPSIMAHLMSHGGDSLRKASPCPLCNTPIVARELRLVRAHVTPSTKVGGRLTFKLLKRARRGIIAEEAEPGKDAMECANVPEEGRKGSKPRAADGDSRVPWAFRAEGCEQAGAKSKVPLLQLLGYNRFSKFSQIADAQLLWQEAAECLAAYASEVTNAGGRDAAQEAPFIYAAIDALANRAASWAERRQRILQEASAHSSDSLSPQQAAHAAASKVKQITNATVMSVGELRRKAEQEKRLEAAEQTRLSQFPTLGASPGRLTPSTFAGHHAARGMQPSFEPAFSDDEDLERSGAAETTAAGIKAAPLPMTHLPEGDDAGVQEAAGPDALGIAAPGTSPAHGRHTLATPQPPANEYYFYQAVDGQWVFLHPLLTRILLSQYGSYEGLPGTIHGQLLELEPQVQTEALRKRLKFLGHLPLGGMYSLAEISLQGEMSEEGLQPFAADLAARAARRAARTAEQQRQDERDAERAEALSKASAAPSAAELKAMPLPGQFQTGRSESEDLEEAFALSLVEESGPDAHNPEPPQSGISFAHMTRMGYAATGPVLSSTPPNQGPSVWGPPPGGLSAAPSPSGISPQVGQPDHGPNAWGGRQSGSLASKLAEAEATRTGQDMKERKVEAPAAKGKKAGKQLIVLGMQNRRY